MHVLEPEHLAGADDGADVMGVFEVLQHQGEVADALVHHPGQQFPAVGGELVAVLFDKGESLGAFHGRGKYRRSGR
jgi:hypothetical protein